MDRTASSTVQYCTLFILGDRDPIQYCLANLLRIGNRSWYKTSRGSRATSQHNSDQFVHLPSAAAVQLSESPSEILSAAAQKLYQRRARLEWSTTSMAASVGEKFPCRQAKRRLLSLVSNMDSQECRCLPLSQRRGEVCNSRNVGVWLGGAGGWPEATLMLPTLSSTTKDPSCFIFRTAWSARICQRSQPYTCGGSLCPPALGHYW